jgi:hypothetical protein
MNVNYKKCLKIVSLVITAVLIGSVSAATYVYMYIDGSITIGTAKLIWIKGIDAPGDATISGGTVTMDLHVQPGYPQNFTDCLFLKNQDTASHNLTITVTNNVSTSTFDTFKIHIYKNSTGSWAIVDTLDGTIVADQYSTYTANTPLITGGFYRLTFEVKAKTGASGTINFDIQTRYE